MSKAEDYTDNMRDKAELIFVFTALAMCLGAVLSQLEFTVNQKAGSPLMPPTRGVGEFEGLRLWSWEGLILCYPANGGIWRNPRGP